MTLVEFCLSCLFLPGLIAQSTAIELAHHEREGLSALTQCPSYRLSAVPGGTLGAVPSAFHFRPKIVDHEYSA